MTSHSEEYLHPVRDQFEAFKALPRDRPIDMLNMLKFRDLAEYPEDHEAHGKGFSGRKAYALYSEKSGPIFQRVGGQIIWSGSFELTLIGPQAPQWDRVFVARYPHAGAFLEMVTDSEYQKAVVNRSAAVATSRLIRLVPDQTDGFG